MPANGDKGIVLQGADGKPVFIAGGGGAGVGLCRCGLEMQLTISGLASGEKWADTNATGFGNGTYTICGGFGTLGQLLDLLSTSGYIWSGYGTTYTAFKGTTFTNKRLTQRWLGNRANTARHLEDARYLRINNIIVSGTPYYPGGGTKNYTKETAYVRHTHNPGTGALGGLARKKHRVGTINGSAATYTNTTTGGATAPAAPTPTGALTFAGSIRTVPGLEQSLIVTSNFGGTPHSVTFTWQITDDAAWDLDGRTRNGFNSRYSVFNTNVTVTYGGTPVYKRRRYGYWYKWTCKGGSGMGYGWA